MELNSKKVVLFLLGLFVGCSQPTKTIVVSVEQPAAPSIYTFEELHQTTHYLATLMVNRVNNQYNRKKSLPVLNCDPDDSKTNMWIMQVKSLIDERQLEFKKQFLNGKLDYKNCEAKCLCGNYAEIVQSINPEKLRRHDLMTISQLEKKQKNITDTQAMTCARNFKSFCDSPLHQYLKSLD